MITPDPGVQNVQDENIKVAIRVRPLNSRELISSSEYCWQVDSDSIFSKTIPSGLKFSFDKIYGSDQSDNKQVFDDIAKSIVDSALMGFNGTVFAYGQTSAGKTFTMKGVDENKGLVLHAFSYIFDEIQKNTSKSFTVKCSYLEIYNEVISDLLILDNTNLKIHESYSAGIFVGNLSEESVHNFVEASTLFFKGEERRQFASTQMNERSSRSHSVFRIVIECRSRNSSHDETEEDGSYTLGVLTFVDLAGSERAGQSGAEGLRLKEGGHINKSLLALTTVISKLADGNEYLHIPFQDSKLTRILQPSLGGNSKTAIICAISPSSESFEETTSTLKFASRAKAIRNVPRINDFVSDKEKLRKCYIEIDRLQCIIDDMSRDDSFKKRRSGSFSSTDMRDMYEFVLKELSGLNEKPLSSDSMFSIIRELSDELSFLGLEYQTFKDQALHSAARCAIAEDTCSNLKKDVAELCSVREAYVLLLEKLETAEASNLQALRDATSAEDALKEDISRLLTENAELQTTCERLGEALSKKICPHCAQVEDKLNVFSLELQKLEEALIHSPKQSNFDRMEINYQKEIDALARELDQVRVINEQLRIEILQRQNDIDLALESVFSSKRLERATQGKYDAILSEKEELRIKLEDFVSQIESTAHEKTLFVSEIEALKTSLNSLMEKNEKLLIDLSNNSNALLQVENQLTLIETMSSESYQKSAELENQLSRSQSSLQHVMEEKKLLVSKIGSLEERLCSFENNIETGEKDTEYLLQRLNELVSQSSDSDKLLSDLRTQLSNTESLRQEDQETIANLQAQISKLNHQLEESCNHWKDEDRATELEMKSKEIEELNLVYTVLKSECDVFKRQNSLLQSDLEEARSSKENIAKMLSRCNDEMSELQSRLSELEQTRNAVETGKTNPTEVLLRIELEKLRDQFLREKKKMSLEISDLEDQLQAISTCNDLNLEIKRLEQENFRLEQLYQASLHKVEYYASLIRKAGNSENNRNFESKDQAFAK